MTGSSGDDRQGSARCHLLDRIVGGVGDVDVAAAVDRHPVGVIQAAAGRGSGRRQTNVAGTGNDRQRAAGCHLLDHIVLRVSDVDVSTAVDGHPGRVAQVTAGRRPGGGETVIDQPRRYRQRARGNLRNHADRPICDVDVATAVDCHLRGTGQVAAGRGAGRRRTGLTGNARKDRKGPARDLLDHADCCVSAM